ELVHGDAELRQPNQIGKGSRNLVHQTDRTLLVGLQVVDELDLRLEARLLVLVALDLVDDRTQACDLLVRPRDFLVQIPAPVRQGERHDADVEKSQGRSAEQNQEIGRASCRERV